MTPDPKRCPRLACLLASLLASLAVLSGCGALGALDAASTPRDVYELRAPAPEAGPSRAGARARDVIVETPSVSGALDTDRIMIRPNRLQAEYLPEARWAEAVPVMVQTLMVRSLDATGKLRYVGRTPLGGSGDVAILTEILDFQAELDPAGDTANVVLRLHVRLVRESDARVTASRVFEAEAIAASTETETIVSAFDAASRALLPNVASWTLANLP